MTKKFKISFIAILISIITILIIIIFLKQDDLKSTNLNLNEKVTASYGIEIKSLKYDGDDNITAEITYTNGPKDCEVGIIILVNGISQPYYTDEHKEESYLIPYNLAKDTNLTIKLNFKPILGKQNEELFIEFGSMLNPSFISSKSYGNNHKVFFLEPYTIICKNSNNNNFSFYEDFTMEHISTKEEIHNNNFNIVVLQNNKEVNKINIKNNMLQFSINLYGEEKEYILSAYINHKIVPLFSGYYYAKIKTTKENISSILIDFDISDLSLNSYDNFYIIAVPTRKGERAYKLGTIVLE
ncbi:MAG: hypothetical protein E7255_06480 [Lachnospiraceae bacterium]|jgi:hypothetical protein|nr:hypothetical protein [Lachnospiraceae bacterium]